MARPNAVFLALTLTFGILESAPALAGVIDDGPQELSQISTIGESLRNAGQRPLHILYVHGIGATGSGGSQTFQKAICAFLKDCTAPAAPVARDYADSGEFAIGADPPAFTYLGKPVWQSKEEWSASTPFVDHYVMKRSDGGPLVVDEINWWPLTFSLKCRAILPGEARLAGPNSLLLNLCSQSTQADASNPGRFKTYTWISPEEASQLKASRGRAALINRSFKTGILDWGFSDAMTAVGSMHGIFRESMRQLFLKSARFSAQGSKSDEWEEQWKDPHGIDREFVVVSHSLGSYLVFSTLDLNQNDALLRSALALLKPGAADEDAAAQYILERTSLVYFFANQVPLLELANVQGAGPAGLTAAQLLTPEGLSGALNSLLMKWKNLRENFAQKQGRGAAAAKPPQVVAWSDPNDLLSWRLPAMEGLVVTNLYVHNTAWHWIIANPAAAHANYSTNKQVLRIMFGPKPPEDKGKAGKL